MTETLIKYEKINNCLRDQLEKKMHKKHLKKELNENFTKNENQKQFLLQISTKSQFTLPKLKY